MPVRALLTTAANGFADVSRLSLSGYLRLALLLEYRYRFARTGRSIHSPGDEVIYRSFERGPVQVLAGWDWGSEYYLLASSAAAVILWDIRHVRSSGATTTRCAERR